MRKRRQSLGHSLGHLGRSSSLGNVVAAAPSNTTHAHTSNNNNTNNFTNKPYKSESMGTSFDDNEDDDDDDDDDDEVVVVVDNHNNNHDVDGDHDTNGQGHESKKHVDGVGMSGLSLLPSSPLPPPPPPAFSSTTSTPDARRSMSRQSSASQGVVARQAGSMSAALFSFTDDERLVLGDGPTHTLMSYMRERQFTAPSDWMGFRPLTSK
jgi:hypothetical protein